MAHVTLHMTGDLPPGVRGMTDGHSTIWLRHTLSQVERRCVLTHELIHLERGDRGHQDEDVESLVRQTTAHRLLPDVHVIAEVMYAAGDFDGAADELWVTGDVLHTRLSHLHPSERAAIKRRLRDLDHGWAQYG